MSSVDAHEIALKSLYWDRNPTLVAATERLREDGYNNKAGHLSAHMAGRFLDAYMAVRAALEASRTDDSGVVELRADAHEAIKASNEYIERLQAYVVATEQFILTQDGELCGLSGGTDDPGRGAKKAWSKFVLAREGVAALLSQSQQGVK